MTTMTTTLTPPAGRVDAFTTLGTPLLSTTDAEQAVKAGGLTGWNVRKAPAYCTDPVTGLQVPMPKTNGVLWDQPNGEVGYFGRVGDVHTIIQNEDQIELLQLFADEAGATFETAGTAKGGARVFITMKLPGRLSIGGQDPVDMYVASINAHDGEQSHYLMRVPLRFACMNMLNVALGRTNYLVKVRHTKAAHSVLKVQAREMLADTFSYMDTFNAVAERLVQTTLTQSRFEQIIAKEYGPDEDAAPATVTRTEAKLDEMARLFADATTQDGIRGTAWAGFNALAEWADHFYPARGDDRDATRATRAILNPEFKTDALRLMLALTK